MKMKAWGSGLLASILVSVAGILILSVLMFRFRWGTAVLAVPVALIQGIASFVGGWLVGRQAPSRHFLWGLVYGALFFGILVLCSLLSGGQVERAGNQLALTAGICLGGGMLGGMFG